MDKPDSHKEARARLAQAWRHYMHTAPAPVFWTINGAIIAAWLALATALLSGRLGPAISAFLKELAN